jgi:calcium/calmodulin-dependent protein kinase I
MIEEDYELFPQKELGRGAFSVVIKGKHRVTGEWVAVKVIHKKDLGADSQKNLKREIDILKRVNHEAVIALKDLYNTKERLYLVMELVEGGELFDKIVEKGSYTEAEAAQLVLRIVSAVQYLHSKGIVHRDLKPENLLLKSNQDVTDVCIADFGLSKIVGQSTMMQTACGTPSYVAPEVLNATGYGEEVDVWSIGVITYILLCGFPPFYGKTVPEIFERIMAADYDFPEEYWDEVSEDAKDFIEQLLVVNPQKRLTIDEALKHKWLKAAAGGTASKHAIKVKDTLSKHVVLRRQESKVTKRNV